MNRINLEQILKAICEQKGYTYLRGYAGLNLLKEARESPNLDFEQKGKLFFLENPIKNITYNEKGFLRDCVINASIILGVRGEVSGERTGGHDTDFAKLEDILERIAERELTSCSKELTLTQATIEDLPINYTDINLTAVRMRVIFKIL